MRPFCESAKRHFPFWDDPVQNSGLTLERDPQPKAVQDPHRIPMEFLELVVSRAWGDTVMGGIGLKERYLDILSFSFCTSDIF